MRTAAATGLPAQPIRPHVNSVASNRFDIAGHVVLPWSHRAFSLLKRWALGTYHGLRRKHIDTYLNEFVFRYNRRFYRHVSFEALLGLATHHEPTGYWDIVNRENPRKP